MTSALRFTARRASLAAVKVDAMAGLSTSFNPVPEHLPPRKEDVAALEDFVLAADGRLLVLTGAGLSTESGIPDYRSAGVGLYARTDRRPLQHKIFMTSAAARKSYWARNFVGWPSWSDIQPNTGHKSLAAMERAQTISHLVTQNVDQLHFKAGSEKVTELHGTNSVVACTSCGYWTHRFSFQQSLAGLNPSFSQEAVAGMIRPDGDVELDDVRQENIAISMLAQYHYFSFRSWSRSSMCPPVRGAKAFSSPRLSSSETTCQPPGWTK